MKTLLEQQATADRRAWWADRRIILALWVCAGLLLVGFIGHVPLERKQEARVLQVAREMLGDWHKWLIPHINGQIRLQKPPLAYWLAASSFKLFGVSVWAGRLPMALLGWLTIALTYRICRELLNARSALLAAGCLTGCYLFYRYGQAAETDIVLTFFLTAAVYAIWRAFNPQQHAPEVIQTVPPFSGGPQGRALSLSQGRAATFAWSHASALAIALAVLAKGPPAALPLLLLIAWACVERQYKALTDYLKSGALITLAIIALPWFVYVMLAQGSATMQQEVTVLIVGVDHPAPFWHYFPLLFKMTFPWAALFPLAIAAAIPHWRRNRSLRMLLIWAAVFFVPFMLIRQKQEHYLLPLMPPLMAIIGWMLDRALTSDDPPLTRAVKWLTLGMAIAGLAAAAVPIVAGQIVRHVITGLDAGIAVATLILMAIVLMSYRRKGLAAAVYSMTIAGTLGMALLLSLWIPSLKATSSHTVADALRQQFGDGPYAFYGEESATLSFLLRQTVPTYATAEELTAAVKKEPRLVVIHEKQKRSQPLPTGFEKQMSWQVDDEEVAAYRATGF